MSAPKTNRDLLLFAIKRIRQCTRELVDSYRDPRTGRIDPKNDPEVAAEVRENRAWLRKATKAVRR